MKKLDFIKKHFSRILLLIFIIIGFFILPNIQKNNSEEHTDKDTLLSIDYSNENYSDLAAWINDTITPSGWKISYLVKDDSTKYTDLYLQWQKDDKKAIIKLESLLEFRRYFIPVFNAENDETIFLTHGCGTYCPAILTLNKNKPLKSTDYLEIVDYNIDLDVIVYITEGSWKFEQDSFSISVADLKNNKDYVETYDNICLDSYKINAIDTIIFENNEISITTTLLEKKYREELITETRTIKLCN